MDQKVARPADRYADRYPHLGTGPVPLAINRSAAQFENERDLVFRPAWHLVGRVEEIPNAGDYFVQDIPTLSTSLIICRGDDQQIRAFHNMCRHRGNKVVPTGKLRGNAFGFSCAFHGWTYDRAGCLAVVPDEEEFFSFSKEQYGLTQVACDVWEGFVFVNLLGEHAPELSSAVAEFQDQFQGYFKDLSLFAHFGADVRCNWKIILDAFAEGYHVPFIHGKTLPEAITGDFNPLCHMQNIRLYARNRSLSAMGNPDYQPSPLEAAIAKYVGMPVFPALKADLEKLPPGVNPERNPAWGFDINIIFPASYFATWANGMLLVYHFWPTSVEETRFEVKLYWEKPRNAAQRINHEITRAMTVSVVREDMSSLETTQEVYQSEAFSHLNLSDQEIAVRHNYEVISQITGWPLYT